MVDRIVQNFEMQLAEIELLKSMYSEDEFKLHDELILTEVQSWIDNPGDELPNTISFVLKLDKAQIYVSFPHDYPGSKCAEILVRSDDLKRNDQSRLNKDLETFTESVFEPECAIVTEIVSWLQDNFTEYFQESATAKCDVKNDEFKGPIFAGRLWLYSHHIYSKIKRKDILDLAKDHSLTGFCMPGKPGIVCLEGPLDLCQDVWSVIKQWTWKKINVKFQEDEKLDNIENLVKWRKFDSFQEIGFVKAETRDYHMDMGEFYKYLQSHECDYMFKELFGIEKS